MNKVLRLCQLNRGYVQVLIFLHLFFTKKSAVQTARLYDSSDVQHLVTASIFSSELPKKDLIIVIKKQGIEFGVICSQALVGLLETR